MNNHDPFELIEIHIVKEPIYPEAIIMSAIEELEKYIKDEGITQISGGIFEDQTRHRLIPNEDPDDKELRYEDYQVKANTTVAAYCGGMGRIHNVSAEEYAKELLGFMTAPSKNIIGECRKCFKFLVEFEDENHEEFCNGIGSQPVEYFLPKKGDTSGNLREVESVEEVGELARTSGKRLKEIFHEGTQEELLTELNEIAIDIAISKGKAEPFKFNDSQKKK